MFRLNLHPKIGTPWCRQRTPQSTARSFPKSPTVPPGPKLKFTTITCGRKTAAVWATCWTQNTFPFCYEQVVPSQSQPNGKQPIGMLLHTKIPCAMRARFRERLLSTRKITEQSFGSLQENT